MSLEPAISSVHFQHITCCATWHSLAMLSKAMFICWIFICLLYE